MKALAVVFLLLVLAGVGMRLVGRQKRRQVLTNISQDKIIQQESGLSMRVVVRGNGLRGMKKGRQNRTTGDMVLTNDRFVLATNRGTIVDARHDHPTFTSARCTGPGRLVLEGQFPASKGDPGLYRVEMMLKNADAWAQWLQPFVGNKTLHAAQWDQGQAAVPEG